MGLFSALCALAPAGSRAATIESEKLKTSDREFISIVGDIEDGDLARFRRLAVAHDDAVVFLASDGGSTLEALEIGKIIRIKGYDTFVSEDAPCNSSCALIWLAGQTKYLTKSARVGFHASYTERNGRKQESGAGNAVVGSYLGQLNLSDAAIVFATSAGPDRLNWLTSTNAQSVGIPVETVADSQERSETAADDGHSNTHLYKHVGTWTIAVDDTLGGGCFVMGDYDRVGFRFGLDARAKLTGYILLLGDNWESIKSSAKYPVEVTFGAGRPWAATATGTMMGESKGIYITFDEGRVFEEMSKARDVRVTYRKSEVAHLALDGSSAAIDAMVQCQTEQQQAHRDPFAR